MVQRLSATSPATVPSGMARAALVWGAGGLGIVISLGALALWFYYGTAVFFEMITSGLSACL